MKLLVVAPYFYPKIGGMENYAYNISKGLRKKNNWDIVVATSNHEERKYKEEFIDGIKIYRLPRWFKLSNTPVNPFWLFSLRKIIKNEKPDLIIGHTPVPYITDLAAIISKFEKIPFVLTYHNDLVKNNIFLNLFLKIYYRTIGHLIYLIPKIIIVTSDYYARNSLYLGKFVNKIRIVSPGVDLSRFSNSSKNKVDHASFKSVLFVGQLDKTHRHKGLYYLLEGFKYVKQTISDVKLIVVGKGDEVEEYKKYAKKLGIESSVEFTGFVSDENLPQYYSNADVVVLPSYTNSEGFGIVLIEAGASKKPVIGSNVGGVPYVINDNKTGFLIPAKNAKSMSEKIVKILKDRKLAERLGENGYLNVVNNFTWDIQIKKTNDLLKEIK